MTARETLVDELGAIQAKLAPFAADITRQTALRATIRTWPEADKKSAGVSVPYSGKKYTVMLGPAENERQWKPGAYAALCKLLRLPKFLATCKVTLKDATAAVGESVVADLSVTARTGSRPLILAEKTT